eukprot:15480290-Alexandrium_andersonii.AAC.1
MSGQYFPPAERASGGLGASRPSSPSSGAPAEGVAILLANASDGTVEPSAGPCREGPPPGPGPAGREEIALEPPCTPGPAASPPAPGSASPELGRPEDLPRLEVSAAVDSRAEVPYTRGSGAARSAGSRRSLLLSARGGSRGVRGAGRRVRGCAEGRSRPRR